MLILPKKIRQRTVMQIRSMVASGTPRKQAMFRVSSALRTSEFKCTTRTLYRWLKEFRISLK